MAYNTALASALHHLEWSTSTSTTPTTAQATVMWGAVYLDVLARLVSCGVTIGTGSDLTAAQEVEALLTSAKVGEKNEIQNDGEVSDHTKWLKAEGDAMLARLCGHDYATALGATVNDDNRTLPNGLAVEFPNDDLDTSDYESPIHQDHWTGRGQGNL